MRIRFAYVENSCKRKLVFITKPWFLCCLYCNHLLTIAGTGISYDPHRLQLWYTRYRNRRYIAFDQSLISFNPSDSYLFWQCDCILYSRLILFPLLTENFYILFPFFCVNLLKVLMHHDMYD